MTNDHASTDRFTPILLAVAGLVGAAGVALAAVAAHRVESPALATAAMMLMIHAAASVAIVSFGVRSAQPGKWALVTALMLAAVTLFGGDIALHTLTGAHLFPMAAPTGGTLLIAAWLAVAVAALIERRRT